ncbi:sulfurtransferase [Actinopolyspora erythraea]|uniref:Sulfurtransferase n=1 Tax=Actinopolyspora erythraea TaxID=414996 RepID=A0A099D308_9ACTN|nr:rhodanese-like domain-containing protein [Actinopolyspora erythraea]ASU77451.1 sulfurtransferase [Actinopolyspora erythraea]KGI80336.1 sulfurtransferase [Actinopolyspora erythraea]
MSDDVPTNETPGTPHATQPRENPRTDPRTRLIDVRSPGEFDAAHIPGSHNVPLDLLRERRDELERAHDDPVMLVCASGARAERARTLLESAGVHGCDVLPGGITAWEREGGEVSRGRGVWPMERQVRLVAGSLVLTGVLGSLAYRPLRWLAGFVGAGLTFAAISDTCAMARLLSLLPHNRRSTVDPDAALSALRDAEPVRPNA